MYKFFVGNNITNFEDNGRQLPISRVTLKVDDENVLTAGDDSGMELLADCPHATQAMVDAVLAQVKGYQYWMFSAGDAGLDPSAELGDGITAGGVYSVISRLADDGSGFPSVTAPGEAELEDEYPEAGPMSREFNRKIAETRSSITKTAEEIRLEVAGLSGQVSTISLKVDSITSTVDGLSGQVSTISQTVNDISLSVTGSLGGTASITLSSGGSKSGTIDLSGVRNAFKNDSTAITIAAGKVSFNAGLFAVNGDTFWIDDNGVHTKNGTHKTSISSGSTLYSEISGNEEVSVGAIGTNYWANSPSIKGLVFSLDLGGYMAWESYESSYDYYVAKMIYVASRMKDADGYTYKRDHLFFECPAFVRNSLNFGVYPNFADAVITPTYGGLEINADGGDSYDPNISFYLNESPCFLITSSAITCTTDLNMNGNEIYNTSDERLKDNIIESDINAMSVLRKIRLYSFDWLETGTHETLGFVAQQIDQEASKDFLKEDPKTGAFSVSQTKMIPYLVKAVKELDEKLNALLGSDASLLDESGSVPEIDNVSSWTPTDYSTNEKLAFLQEIKKARKAKPAPKPKPVIMPPH